jgi:hypothetical protein
LSHVLAEDRAERLVEQVRRRVIRHRREAHLPGDDGPDAVARRKALAAEHERLVAAEPKRGLELHPRATLLDPAGVRDLPATLRVERRFPELHQERAVAEILERTDLRQHVRLLIADEQRLEAGGARELGSALRLTGASRPGDLAVRLH